MPLQNILVIRNDKLGDFMLAWPALQLLKEQYPNTQISVLIPPYTEPVAKLCPWIDHILVDTSRINSYSGGVSLSKTIKSGSFDAVVTLFSEFRTGLAVWLCAIPIRVAPASKIAQIFYNRKLVQRRSRSEKPEYQYNIDLAKYFIEQQGDSCSLTPAPPYLVFDSAEIDRLRSEYINNNSINCTHLIIIHPGSGGSANNLSLAQYGELIRSLSELPGLHFIITAGPDEIDPAKQLSAMLAGVNHSIYHSTEGLVNFAKFIAICDLFISGSTGPLHIAGALNKRTAAFYPTRKSATSLRWQTLNSDDRRLSFTMNESDNSDTAPLIDIQHVSKTIANSLQPGVT